jgi:deoxyribonuclease-2
VRELNQLAYRLMITRPFIFENYIKNSSTTNNLADLAAGKSAKIAANFQTEEFSSSGYRLRSIYKNGYENCSIFEDGLISYFKSNMTAETWGRPLEPAWCQGNWKVNNVLKVAVGSLSWKEEDDHSKWVLVGSSQACFGDMNRMPSQWKRGGSFFCFDNPSLVLAVKRVIAGEDNCK